MNTTPATRQTILTRYLATACLALLMACPGNDRQAAETETHLDTEKPAVVEVIALHDPAADRRNPRPGRPWHAENLYCGIIHS